MPSKKPTKHPEFKSVWKEVGMTPGRVLFGKSDPKQTGAQTMRSRRLQGPRWRD